MALKDKLMTLEDFKAVRDVDVASNSAQFTEIKADLGAQTGIISKTSDHYINLTTDPVDISNPSTSSTGLTYAVVDCSKGDKFVVNAVGTTSGRAWGFLDSSNHVLSMADANATITDLELTAPTNAVKLVINDKGGGMSYKVGNNLATKADNGLSDDIKSALLACFEHVAYIDGQGQTYYNNLLKALNLTTYPGIVVFFDSKGNDIYDTDSLESLKKYLTVTYYTSKNDNGSIISANDYELSGSLNTEKNTITVTYSGVQSIFSVNVVEAPQTITFAPNYNFTNNRNATPLVYAQYNSTRRQSFATTNSKLPKFKQTSAGTDSGTFTNDSPYSAIKFPKGKTSVTVTCSNSNRCNINWYSLSSDYYRLNEMSGWRAANTSFTFNKTNYEYFVIIFDSNDNTASHYSLRFN